MNSWQELTVEVLRDTEEAASNILIELGSQGVVVDDSADYLGRVGKYGEVFPGIRQVETVKITAYYPENVDIEAVGKEAADHLAELTDFGVDAGNVHYVMQELAEQDQTENWKKYYEPTRIGHDLTTVPGRTDYEASEGEKIIRLDPGTAFGIGTYPTAKMNLFALEQVLRGGGTVLDVGTGSGVLLITSSLLGAKDIYAYNLNEVAVHVARENIDSNANTENIYVTTGNLLQGVGTQVDAIVANTFAGVLVNMTEDAYRLVKDEDYLIMSGIIFDKWDMVRKPAEDAGFPLEAHMVQGEQNACIFKRADDIPGVIGG